MGEVATRTIEVEVDQFARGSVANTVEVSSADDDPHEGNNADDVTTQIEAETDLIVTLSAAPDPVVAGTPLSYTLTLSNTGPSGAIRVDAVQTLPNGVRDAGGCSEAADTVICTVDRLGRDTRERFTISVDVLPFTRGTLTSMATVSGAPDERELYPDNNEHHPLGTPVIAQTDLRISMTDRPDPAVAGTFLRYAIDVANDGPSGATRVSLSDRLPPGVLFVPALSTTGCDPTADGVTCEVVDLEPGTGIVLTLAVVPSAAGTLINTAEVTGADDEEDPDPAYNTATAETMVASPAGGPAGGGDFNGDGHLDLAVVDENHDRVKIFLNDGHGSFTEHAQIPVGRKPRALAAGDVTGDGHLDLVVVNWVSDDVSILAGLGTGAFVEIGRPGVTGLRPAAVTLGDFDGDGWLDIAAAAELSDSVAILCSDGAGGFVQTTEVPLGSGRGRALHPSAIATGDVDGDGALDLAVANQADNSVYVLTNDGWGAFTLTATVPLPGQPAAQPLARAIGDYDGDGLLDLAAANSVANTVAVLRNDGAGGFAEASPRSPVGQRPVGIAAGDLTGNGALDLVTADRNSDAVSLLGNDGSGQFVAAAVPAGSKPIAVVVGDFDGDADLDVVAIDWPSITPVFLSNTLE